MSTSSERKEKKEQQRLFTCFVSTIAHWMYASASSEQFTCTFFLKKIIVGSHPLCLFVSCREPQTDYTGTRMICRNASWMHFTCLEQLDMSPRFIRHMAFVWRVSKMYPFSKPWYVNINMGEQWTSNLGTICLTCMNKKNRMEWQCEVHYSDSIPNLGSEYLPAVGSSFIAKIKWCMCSLWSSCVVLSCNSCH